MLNEIFETNSCGLVKVIKVGDRKCVVTFLSDGFTKEVYIANLLAGKVKNPYHISKYGVAYLGEFDKLPYWKQARQLWNNMIKRCYCTKDPRGYYGTGVVVSTDWLCFANFLKDISNLPNFDKWLLGQRTGYDKYNLDKDLLVEGNKVYSKHTCQFVQEGLNKADGARRGKPFTKTTRVGKD